MPTGEQMTKEEAKATVEAKLRKQQLTRPLTETEMTAFCQAMYQNLEFPSKTNPLSDIRVWTESWQSTEFRSN
jgi:hypothetical protein